MKKARKIILVTLCSLLILGIFGVGNYLIYNHFQSDEQTGNMAGVEWYSEVEKEFTISTADELYELARLSEFYDFKGQTVKLDADIVINEGNAADWDENAPARKWNSILNFAGKFDGQGHTISGMYAVGSMESVGMFTDTKRGAVIKNFKLVNSYFRNNGDKGTGSILSKGGGTIDTVYSDALVYSSGWHSGGLVGSFTISGSNKITNCWFDGTLTMEMEYGRYAGGILGTVNALGAKNTIEHCLNSGTITTAATSNPCIGGICGVVMTGGSLQLTDNLNVGNIDTKRGIYGIGSILGRVVGKTTVAAIDNNYASSESYYTALGGSEGKMTGNSVRIRNVNLVGYEGFQWTELDFEKYWAVVMDDTPVLQSFTDTIVDLDGVAKKIDKTWYQEGIKEFTLTTAAQLFGFAEISRTVDFKGVTIKLGADIVCNEGKASDWGEKEPINIWKPIGYNGEFGGKTFLGTFDGQGHTISGLYAKSTSSMVSFFGETGAGSVVKNLKIKNSYFEAQISKSTSWGMVAGAVAKSWGTIDTVYSDAILVNSGTVTGGIVGMMRITGKDGGECMIRNCWYDGQITANGSTGGIIGDIYGCPTTVEHCLNTGSIETIKASGNIGGLVGIVEIQDAKLTLIDSLNVGKIKDASKKSWNVGSAIGRVVKTEKVTNIVADIKNVYVSKEVSGNAIGNKTGNFTGSDIVRLSERDLIGKDGYFNTGLSFYEGGKGYWIAEEGKTPLLKSFATGKALAVGGLRVDISWYNKNDDTYTIKDAAQLYGLRQLSETMDFKGKTIKLAKDIKVNDGDANTWGTKAPTYSWKPIGYNAEFGGKTFQGTFDGQGYSVSGLYGKTTKYMMAFFGEIGTTGLIKNLKVTNSYFESHMKNTTSWGMVASVAAKSWGTVDTVYSDAILVNNGTVTGGIVGMMRITGDVEGACIVRNSWFDGEIMASDSTGGIIGDVYGCEATIESCLFTGTIGSLKASGNVGGLCGLVEIKGGKLNLIDSLSSGTIDLAAKSWNQGSILGRAVEDAKGNVHTEVYVKDVYAAKVTHTNTLGNKTINMSGDEMIRVSAAELTGDVSYLKTQLGFYIAKKNETGKWVVFADSTPQLKSFAKTGALDLTNALCVDTSWYKEELDKFEIKTMSQLYGLSELSKTTDFAGKTIELKDTVTLNKGNAADWKETAPKYSWTPIQNFAGTFDGGMNTINGIYVKSDKPFVGLFGEVTGTVKRLILDNSYIEDTYAEVAKNLEYGATGSVVGRLRGTLHTVKSNAIVVLGGSEYAGGLVGDIVGTTGGKIQNCWFAGSVSGKGSHHGTLLGGVRGALVGSAVSTDSKGTIENCLSTGKIDLQANTGGLVGALWNSATLTLTDTLFAGEFVDINGTPWGNYGAVVGNQKNGTLTVKRVYTLKDSKVGYVLGYPSAASKAGIYVRELEKITGAEAYNTMNLDFFVKGIRETGEWYAVTGSTPILASFAGTITPIDLSGTTSRTGWYQKIDGADEFVLYTTADFRGFQELSKTTNFAGDTVKLGADINLNPGWNASTYSYLNGNKDARPNSANDWNSIGYSGITTTTQTYPKFAGIFDGDMHTISGVFMLKWTSGRSTVGLFGEVDGAVIKNFTLSNSYFYVDSTAGKSYVGSIVGLLKGTLSTVKCDETVYVELPQAKEYNGGMVGGVTGTSTISNCWFAGSLSGKAIRIGGIVGGMAQSGSQCTVEHCLMTGTIQAANHVGGIFGTAWTGTTLIFRDSLFAGRIATTSGGAPTNSGTVIDDVNKITPTISTVYSHIYEEEVLHGAVGVGSNKVAADSITRIEAIKLILNAARENTQLSIYPEGMDSSSDGENKQYWWYVSNQHPVLASFATVQSVAAPAVKKMVTYDTAKLLAVRARFAGSTIGNN